MGRFFLGRLAGAVLALAMVALTSSAAHADPRDFTFLNAHPSLTVEELYVSSSSQVEWGEDVLGRDVLAPGESATITFGRFTVGDCLYDIKVVAENGSESMLNQVNLCETTTVTYH